MADTTLPALNSCRGLQCIWVPGQAAWLFVWSQDNGALDLNHRLCYFLTQTPADFDPQRGIYILAKGLELKSAQTDPDLRTYVYGVPTSISVYSDCIKVQYTDLNPALGWPRKTIGEDTPADYNGKSPHRAGIVLEGQFSQSQVTEGPILWTVKHARYHANQNPVLEVTDLATVTKFGKNRYGAPTGTMCVAYERDDGGRVVTDEFGFPLIQQISNDEKDLFTAQNYKVGYLALNFVPNFYGAGLHGWVAAAPEVPYPFMVSLSENNGTTAKASMYPGTVDGVLPSNINDKLPINVEETSTYYVVLTVASNGVAVKSLKWGVQTTAPTPNLAKKDVADSTFLVLVAVVKGGTIFPIWRKNLNAQLTVAFQEPKTSYTPGTNPYHQYWKWEVS